MVFATTAVVVERITGVIWAPRLQTDATRGFATQGLNHPPKVLLPLRTGPPGLQPPNVVGLIHRRLANA